MPEPQLVLPKAPTNWDLIHLGARLNEPSTYCNFHPNIDHQNVGSPLMADTTYDALFQQAWEQYKCYPDWRTLKALAISESSLDPNANTNAAGAGLMQINPFAHPAPIGAYIPPNNVQRHASDTDKSYYNRVYWITHPKESIFEGAKILCRYVAQLGSLNAGILGYKGFAKELTSTRAQEILTTYHNDYNQLITTGV